MKIVCCYLATSLLLLLAILPMQAAPVAPTVSRNITLTNTSVKSLSGPDGSFRLPYLHPILRKFLPDAVSVSMRVETNSLYVTAPDERSLAQVETFFRELDQPNAPCCCEVLFVEMPAADARKLQQCASAADGYDRASGSLKCTPLEAQFSQKSTTVIRDSILCLPIGATVMTPVACKQTPIRSLSMKVTPASEQNGKPVLNVNLLPDAKQINSTVQRDGYQRRLLAGYDVPPMKGKEARVVLVYAGFLLPSRIVNLDGT